MSAPANQEGPPGPSYMAWERAVERLSRAPMPPGLRRTVAEVGILSLTRAAAAAVQRARWERELKAADEAARYHPAFREVSKGWPETVAAVAAGDALWVARRQVDSQARAWARYHGGAGVEVPPVYRFLGYFDEDGGPTLAGVAFLQRNGWVQAEPGSFKRWTKPPKTIEYADAIGVQVARTGVGLSPGPDVPPDGFDEGGGP